MRFHPRRSLYGKTSSGNRTRSENVVLVCERIRGAMGWRASPASGNFPVKTARPMEAETPQRKAADAMKKYPRRECAFRLEFTGFRLRPPNPMMSQNQRAGQAVRDQIRE